MNNLLVQPEIDLAVEELEELEAPGFWDGVALGAAFSGAVGAGIAIGIALT
ncbi:hypothetical protein ACIQGZ_27070 [Streptomyces sp. NPDC092296]|uniref:hypothetical protein n=1 Tax=Streptomyces sp. NPDC092296 TaxID=3366012 RepID=UPI003805E375